jgi:YVTN family beta-propeller protein
MPGSGPDRPATSALTAAVVSTLLIAAAPVCGEQRFGVVTRTEIQAKAIGEDVIMAAASPIVTVPGMPFVIDPNNLYSEAAAGPFSPVVADALPRVYVPNRQSNSISVIDPATYKVVDHFKVGISPQHVVPSWDLKTLWVANNGRRGIGGSLTPIDPRSGKPGPKISVDDPYNLYFTPDGRSAIVVAETRKRLDFRDPHTMALQQSLPTPSCSGVNHADFPIDGRYAIFTCEFRGGGLVKIDMVDRKVLGYLPLSKHGMPQDIRIAPDASPTCTPTACFWWMATRSRKSASSPPVSALMGSIRAATLQSSTSPIAAHTASSGGSTVLAAYRL